MGPKDLMEKLKEHHLESPEEYLMIHSLSSKYAMVPPQRIRSVELYTKDITPS